VPRGGTAAPATWRATAAHSPRCVSAASRPTPPSPPPLVSGRSLAALAIAPLLARPPRHNAATRRTLLRTPVTLSLVRSGNRATGLSGHAAAPLLRPRTAVVSPRTAPPRSAVATPRSPSPGRLPPIPTAALILPALRSSSLAAPPLALLMASFYWAPRLLSTRPRALGLLLPTRACAFGLGVISTIWLGRQRVAVLFGTTGYTVLALRLPDNVSCIATVLTVCILIFGVHEAVAEAGAGAQLHLGRHTQSGYIMCAGLRHLQFGRSHFFSFQDGVGTQQHFDKPAQLDYMFGVVSFASCWSAYPSLCISVVEWIHLISGAVGCCEGASFFFSEAPTQ
jgi:hypothetical protein